MPHWIRVHGGLFEKPVVTRLSEAAHISKHEAVGVLVTFWSAVSMNATNGQVACYSDSQLETWAKWSRKRGVFAAWVRAYHVDDDGRVREWDEYQGPLEYRREADRARKAAERVRKKSAGHPRDVRVTSARNEDDTIRNETKTNRSSSARGVEKSGRELLLEHLTPTRRRAMESTIAMWEQGVDLPPGCGIPTAEQIDTACRECVASVDAAQVSVNVLRGFLVKVLRPSEALPRGRQSESLTEALLRP